MKIQTVIIYLLAQTTTAVLTKFGMLQ